MLQIARLALCASLLFNLHAAILNTAKAQDSSQISLYIDGQIFFVNDEYYGRRIEGYTLPGFRLTPKLSWEPSDRITLRGGFSWLHYWGAHAYPTATSYAVLPDHSDTVAAAHVVPWLQAKIRLAKGLELTLGTLDPTDHHLPSPLYNTERLLAADPENGLQLAASGSWGDAEAWVDWREFIWNNSPRQERLTIGASGRLQCGGERWLLLLPLHFVAQHVGGQVLQTTTRIQNNFNAAAGLTLRHAWDDWTASLGCNAMWYHQYGNPIVPFSHGWALYPMLEVAYGSRAVLTVSYWRADRFVPLMGSWLYSSLSSVDHTTVFDHTRVLSLRAVYKWSVAHVPFVLHTEGSAHYDIGERQMQYSMGCVLSFSPSIHLR